MIKIPVRIIGSDVGEAEYDPETGILRLVAEIPKGFITHNRSWAFRETIIDVKVSVFIPTTDEDFPW